jgi:exosortase
MLPLPFTVETYLAQPLQRFATAASAFVLQLFALPAVAEGNTITMESGSIQVVEACNGLGMLVTFFAMTTGVVLLLRNPWPDKVVMVLSAVPIALAANIARITITAFLAELVSKAASDAFHNYAEFFMMPFALGLIWLEWALLSRLFIKQSTQEMPLFNIAKPAPALAGSHSGKTK